MNAKRFAPKKNPTEQKALYEGLSGSSAPLPQLFICWRSLLQRSRYLLRIHQTQEKWNLILLRFRKGSLAFWKGVFITLIRKKRNKSRVSDTSTRSYLSTLTSTEDVLHAAPYFDGRFITCASISTASFRLRNKQPCLSKSYANLISLPSEMRITYDDFLTHRERRLAVHRKFPFASGQCSGSSGTIRVDGPPAYQLRHASSAYINYSCQES